MPSLRMLVSLLVLWAAAALWAGEGAPNEAAIGNFEKGGNNRFEKKMLFSFEGQDAGKFILEDWPEEFKGKSAMAVVEEHASDRKKALRLDSGAPAGNVQFSEFAPDWSRYDSLVMDIFNPTDKPAQVGGWIRGDDPKADYYHRCNWDRVLKPGFNSLKFSLGGLQTQGFGLINLGKVVSFNIGVNRQTIFIDNIRLVAGTEEVPVPGMKKYDFGPPVSALMPGFTAVSGQSRYDKARGFGWLPGADVGRDFDISDILNRHRPPDDLCRDACMPTLATFAVDLPNGAYRGWLMMSPPRIGWGSHFKHRTVKANGKVILDQEFTLESYKAWEFAFQDSEDLPGDDLWDRYIAVLFQPTLFEFTAADGQLKLEFDSHEQYRWSSIVHGLVLWPKNQEGAAAKWLANLGGQRKEQYQAQHVEKLPDAPPPYAAGAEDKARGYVRFVHSPDREINLNSVPTPEEAAKNALELCAAPGETVDACFGLYPLQDCGKLKLTLSDLAGPGGAAIPAKNLQLQVCRYKALNKSAVYTPLPRYLDAVPAEGIEIKGGITRSFWLIASVAEGTPAGAYKGEVRLAWSNGKSERLEVNLTVWPIKLVEPDFPIGIFMMGPFAGYLDLDKTGQSRWEAWKDVLADARAHGLTSIDPMINIPLVKYQNGKAEVDFSDGDRFMELARAAGFKQELCGYSLGLGFRMKISTQFDPDAEGKRLGAPDYGQLVKAYFDAVHEHAKEKGWLPICFCTDDEYLIHPGGSKEKLASLHRILQQNAPGFHFVPFDSVVLGKSAEEDAACEKMLADIDTWGGNYHSPRQAEIARKCGRRLWLYNTGMDRFTFGAYMFFAHRKHDVSGFTQWVYPSGGTYGLFYLASFVESQYGVVYPSTRGLRSTPVWERIRAGCNDHRYLETAWLLLEKAKAELQKPKSKNQNPKSDVAAELQGVLDKLFSQLKFGNVAANPVEAEGGLDLVLSPAALDNLRKKLAEGIAKLQMMNDER